MAKSMSSKEQSPSNGITKLASGTKQNKYQPTLAQKGSCTNTVPNLNHLDHLLHLHTNVCCLKIPGNIQQLYRYRCCSNALPNTQLNTSYSTTPANFNQSVYAALVSTTTITSCNVTHLQQVIDLITPTTLPRYSDATPAVMMRHDVQRGSNA